MQFIKFKRKKIGFCLSKFTFFGGATAKNRGIKVHSKKNFIFYNLRLTM